MAPRKSSSNTKSKTKTSSSGTARNTYDAGKFVGADQQAKCHDLGRRQGESSTAGDADVVDADEVDEELYEMSD
ncbi:hypothetical protein TSUD_129380 [Trifolium subterraneum]|uniref:Uncharacterized protein n=1 Tax=Trifolium subterraneum TaxID=3900 RepID=A0A2Z6NTJ8_TRISU|nr:hypothetical protein TSUD_129380 [Trifolium subterraneum]